MSWDYGVSNQLAEEHEKDLREEIFNENVAELPEEKRPGFPCCLQENEGFKCTKPEGHKDPLHCAVGILGYVHHEWDSES